MKLKTLDEKKVEILDKLAAAGIDTEKKMTSLKMGEAFVIAEKSNIRIHDLQLIYKFQDAIKRRRLYSFLAGGVDDKEGKDDGTGRTAAGSRAGEADDEGNEDRVEGDGSEVDLGTPRLY